MPEREDKALEEYLGGGSRLSGAYRDSASDEPSADLDEVVIEAARRELHLGPKVAYSPFTRSWRWPLALTAVLVVSVTVTFVLHEYAGGPLPAARQPPADIGTREAIERRTAPETAAEPPAPRKKQAPVLEPKAVAPTTSREGAPAAAAERAAPFPAESAAPPPAQTRVPAAADAAAPAAPQPKEEKARASTPLRAAKEAPDMTPEQWLTRIEALRKEGRQAEADALLAEFRQRFPDYPLPEPGK